MVNGALNEDVVLLISSFHGRELSLQAAAVDNDTFHLNFGVSTPSPPLWQVSDECLRLTRVC